MAVIARDQVAFDQLVYAWPFPIGPEAVEVTCGDEEIVVMCPAWSIGDRLGPGRHHWRTPDPARPTNVYFVLTAPVEVPFDMMTQFVIPSTQQPVRLRAQGSVLARCIDPALLVAQFVGLPFDNINDGVIRSVGASCERLLARVLVRRVLAAGTPFAVTDPSMLPSIVDELTAYNPTAGAVTGVGFVRFNQLVIQADDGGMGGGMWTPQQGWTHVEHQQPYVTGGYQFGGDSVPGMPYPGSQPYTTGALEALQGQPYGVGPDELAQTAQPYATGGFAATPTPAAPEPPPPPPPPPAPASNAVSSASAAVVSGEIGVVSGEIGAPRAKKPSPEPEPAPAEAPVVASAVFPQGMRVLVSAPNGTLHAAVVVSYRGEYYEVEIGASKDVIWVPQTHVIPDR